MKRRINFTPDIDWVVLVLYIVLILLGWLNIYSAVFDENHKHIFDLSQRYGRQLLWIGAAFILALVVFLIDSRMYSFFAYAIYGLFILVLIGLLIFGKEIHGSKSWIVLGNFQIQPSEFSKMATGLALARYLSGYNIKIQNFRSTIIVCVIILIPAALILLQHDTGSTLVYLAFILPLYREGLSGIILFIGIFLIIMFILSLLINNLIIIIALIVICFGVFTFLTRKFKFAYIGFGILLIINGLVWLITKFSNLHLSAYYIILISLSASALIYLYFIYFKKIQKAGVILLFLILIIGFTFSVNYVFTRVLEKHQQHRINILLGLESDLKGKGYNVNQSKIAIGSGGLTGKGFLQGTQTKFNFVPEQSTDFIFCTVGEEWGFVGSMFVLALFTLLILRLIQLAERQRSNFSRIYGYCVVSLLFFHIAVNIGMAVGLMPVIGIPLPFFSYGGSSLWAFTIMVFIFLRLDARRMELM